MFIPLSPCRVLSNQLAKKTQIPLRVFLVKIGKKEPIYFLYLVHSLSGNGKSWVNSSKRDSLRSFFEFSIFLCAQQKATGFPQCQKHTFSNFSIGKKKKKSTKPQNPVSSRNQNSTTQTYISQAKTLN